MKIAFILSEPLSFGWGMVMMVAILLGILILVSAGAYLFLRVFASLYNSRQRTWDSAADDLGLTIDTSKQSLHKDFLGNREGFDIRVSRYPVPRGESSWDDHVAVEVTLSEPFDFSFEIAKPEMAWQIARDFFADAHETGIGYLDKAFTVKCSHMPSLVELLTADISDAESTNLVNDLMRAKKNFFRVIFTGRTVTLGAKADIGDAAAANRIIEKAVDLAKRVYAAKAETRPVGSVSDVK